MRIAATSSKFAIAAALSLAIGAVPGNAQGGVAHHHGTAPDQHGRGDKRYQN
jgi:hypothetical protein